MKLRLPNHRFAVATTVMAALTLSAVAQEWTLLDDFDDMEALPTGWVKTAQPNVDGSFGFLSIRPTENTNTTATYRVQLPKNYIAGKFTIAFDFYLPDGPQELALETGFGVASLDQVANNVASWPLVGSRNRFQMIGPAPQALGNAYDWGVQGQPGYGTAQPDCLGTTERGVVYNIWLVYNLDEAGKGVTIYSKKSTDPMESRISFFFPFDGAGDDDWYRIRYFVIGQGFMSNAPAPYKAWDALGALYDNIYVSDGENLSLTPTSFQSQWEQVETFANGAPEALWTIEDGVNVSIDGRAATFSTGENDAYVGAILPLPVPVGRGSMTLTMDMKLPAVGTFDNTFGVVNASQLAGSGIDRFGEANFFTYAFDSSTAVLNNAKPPAVDLFAPTVLDQWYHVWLVYDTSGNRVDFYSVPFAAEGLATPPAAPTASFNWTAPLSNLTDFIVGAGDFGGGAISLANIYQTFGTNISLSLTAGNIDGGGPVTGILTPGAWTTTDIGEVWGFDTWWGWSELMGPVYINDPWIYQPAVGWMVVVASDTVEGGTSYWLYSQTGEWIYTAGTTDWLGTYALSTGGDWSFGQF